MGVQSLDTPSPVYEPLAGTHICYELDCQVRVDSGTVELGKFHWKHPVELVLKHPDEVFAFNLALSPRPRRARISPPGHANDESLENIGRVLLIYPGSTFRLSVPSGHVRSLYCGINRTRLEQMVGDLDDFDETRAGLQSRLNSQIVELLLNRMYEELRDGRFASQVAVDAYVTALTVELARAIRTSKDGREDRHKGGLAPGRMRLLKDRIHAEAPAPHLLELADLCGMTVRQLSRAFKQETGKTLGKYIDDINVERAFRLLTETHRPISEIATTLGFSTPAGFSYSFRRSTGMAPSELRRRGAQ
jgi:AraC family transcriptional regulator